MKFYCVLNTEDIHALSHAASTLIWVEHRMSAKGTTKTRQRLSDSVESIQGVLNHIQESSVEIPDPDDIMQFFK